MNDEGKRKGERFPYLKMTVGLNLRETSHLSLSFSHDGVMKRSILLNRGTDLP
jgi:hypothetical protein